MQEKVYKHASLFTNLNLSTTPLMNGCRNDDIHPASPTLFSVAVSVRPDQ